MTTIEQHQRAVERWNEQHPPGTLVTVRLDSGEIRTTRTRSAAWMLGESSTSTGHSPVVLLDGVSGCYLLSRVRAILQRTAAAG